MNPFILTLAVILLLLILWLVQLFNSLIRSKNRVQEAYSDVDVQLKRRYDLIPNLVETVKGYMQHEAKTLQAVTEARRIAMSAEEAPTRAKAEDMLTGALKSLFAVAENYPDLKASGNFAKLQDELSDTENKIQAARRFYNGMVRDFNTKTQTFPNNMVAQSLNFKPFAYFEVTKESERENVSVKF
ncbi:MAG: LemA family protein [Candidatus Komeilibacteria bacterium]|nr:LemA family protein [Candidatus Komeilibacteria bacterium]